MNKYGVAGIPIDWDSVKAMYCSGQTAREIATIFKVCANTIQTRAKRGKWSLLRKRTAAAKQAAAMGQSPSKYLEPEPDRPEPVMFRSSSEVLKTEPRRSNEFASDVEIIKHAITIGDSTQFRSRVLKANDSALKVLEDNPPTNVGECDRFAEALTKVERIGARTYGYDREANQPVVNIAMLTSSDADYD